MNIFKRKKKPPFMVRQGDVLLIKVNDLPEGVGKNVGHRILKEGEATDHIHTVRNPKVILLDRDEKKYLNVPKGLGQVIDPDTGKCIFTDGTILEHVNVKTGNKAEHNVIPLPPGTYEVRSQMEYAGDNCERKEEYKSVID